MAGLRSGPGRGASRVQARSTRGDRGLLGSLIDRRARGRNFDNLSMMILAFAVSSLMAFSQVYSMSEMNRARLL